jgi:hypothetical protein
MDASSDENSVYRFAAFAARGTITLTKDSVHVKTWTYRGWWEQTIPLEYLSPIYGTLTTTPPVYAVGWMLAISFVCAGGFYVAVPTLLRVIKGACLLLFGLWFMWYLWRHRRTEWIMFPAHAHGWGRGVCYTRQGPDAEFCDEFTRRMVIAIRSKRSPGTEQN